MKVKIFFVFILITILSACVSIPKETVTLSQTLGSDLKILHNSHRNMVVLYYSKLKNDINILIDDVYAPHIIHYVLKVHLEYYKAGEESIYGAIEKAGKEESKEASLNALDKMTDFITIARKQIENKRAELLDPIELQEMVLLNKINQSYENAIYANSTLTSYLISARKVKEAQSNALSMVGLQGMDTLINNNLILVSDKVNEAIIKGKEIDVKSDGALQELERILKQVGDLTK